jgi:hypothetical protein
MHKNLSFHLLKQQQLKSQGVMQIAIQLLLLETGCL